MKKLLVALGLTVVLLLALALAGYVFLGRIVVAGVNTVGPKVTGTKVVLGGARISPLSGTGTLTDLVVANPAGWSEHPLCSLGRIHVDVAPPLAPRRPHRGQRAHPRVTGLQLRDQGHRQQRG